MDRKLLAKAISNIELLDIYLNESSVTRDKDFDHGVAVQDIRQQKKMAVSADILGTADEAEKQASLLRALVTVGVRYVPDPERVDEFGEASKKALAEIEATFCAVYRYKDELSDDELTEFLRFNAVHNVWPFWREHALRVAAEAKLPRPSIPLMKPQNK